jgi:ESF2/ABP1 family protein
MSSDEADDTSDVSVDQSANESINGSDQDHNNSPDELSDGSDDHNDNLDPTEQQMHSDDEEQQEEERPRKKVRKLKLTATQDFNATLSKRGILYLSRIPPRMGPSKVKTLLSDFGPISRIYLVEEDKVVRKKRRKAGGSGCKRYTEGWVEFESKKVAKRVGETLNMTRVTNHKRSLHYDDLWNVKVSTRCVALARYLYYKSVCTYLHISLSPSFCIVSQRLQMVTLDGKSSI